MNNTTALFYSAIHSSLFTILSAVTGRRCWCEGPDLNRHGFTHTPLKRARLPIPPPSQIFPLISTTKIIIAEVSSFVNTFFKFFKKYIIHLQILYFYDRI